MKEDQDQKTTPEGTNRPLRFPMNTGREPIDLAEWPVVTLAHAPIRNAVIIENVLGARPEGSGIPQGWELFLRDAAIGAPIAGDQDVYVAIMAILHETDFRERVLRITRADVCRVLEWLPSDKKYHRIEEALSRFRNVTYKGKNIFTDPKTGDRFGYIEFGFVDSFAFSDRPPKRRKGAAQPELPLSYIRLADEFLILCRQANLKLIDLDFYRALSRPETRWLYRFLDKNLYKRNEYRIGLNKLRRKQGLVSGYDPKYIKRDHAPRLDELQAKGFLRSYRFEKSRDPEEPWQLWVEKNPAFSTRRAPRKISDTESPRNAKRSPDERIRTNTTPLEAPTDATKALVAYFHDRFHGTPAIPTSASEIAKARDLLARCEDDFERACFCVDWIFKEAERTRFAIQNFSGLLLNGYPERALAALSATKDRASRNAARQEIAELRDRYDVWYRRESRARMEALAPAERQNRIAESLSELRADRTGGTFSSLPERTQEQIAQRRVERSLAADLPAFEEWSQSQSPGL
jgi:hypothetical protein